MIMFMMLDCVNLPSCGIQASSYLGIMLLRSLALTLPALSSSMRPFSSTKYSCSLLVHPPTERMWKVRTSWRSGALEMVKGCHSNLLITGRLMNIQSPG